MPPLADMASRAERRGRPMRLKWEGDQGKVTPEDWSWGEVNEVTALRGFQRPSDPALELRKWGN